MPVSVTAIRPATAEEWDRTWDACDYATFYHSRTWAETWSAYTHGALQPAPMTMVFSDGTQALLPLSCRRALHGVVKRFVSSPARTYGGWISSDSLAEEHACHLFDALAEFKDLVWRINPFDPLQHPQTEFAKLDDTDVLSLDGGFAAIHKEWSKGSAARLRQVKQAVKFGVSVRAASGLEDWHRYFDVYLDSLRRWGGEATSRYRKDLFERLCETNSPNVKLWLAWHEDRVIAGSLCFYARRHVSYWHGATLEESLRLRPSPLLMYESIKDACDRGYRWFDFNPSGGHEGVKAFKKTFGTRELPCPVVARKSTLSTAVAAVSGISGRLMGRRRA